MAEYQFDFGSGMPLPPPRIKQESSFRGEQTTAAACPSPDSTQPFTLPGYGYIGKPRYASLTDDYGYELYYHRHSTHRPVPRYFRSLYDVADTRLLDYLHSRHISPAFLKDIDFFLDSHPEIARYKSEWTHRMNYAAPLDAYLHFVRGWLRPARYLDSYLPDPVDIPLLFDTTPLAETYDQELVDFFGRYEYRDDVLKRIDREVYELVSALWQGPNGCNLRRMPTYPERQLVVLGLYANVVDVYKFYEHCYQTDGMPHRNMGDHSKFIYCCVFHDIASIATRLEPVPRQLSYSMPTRCSQPIPRPQPIPQRLSYPAATPSSQPTPRQVAYPGEDCQEDRRSHISTRVRMARANDVGMNVINVLLDDFTTALCRRGFSNDVVQTMRTKAMRDIDHQRVTLGGLDIVDMVMNRARAVRSRARPPDRLAVRPPPIPTTAGKKAQRLAMRLTQIEELKKEVRVLREQESNGELNLACMRKIHAKRRRSAEAQLVRELIIVLQKRGDMTPHEAEHWQKVFSSKQVKSREAKGLRVDPLEQFEKWLS